MAKSYSNFMHIFIFEIPDNFIFIKQTKSHYSSGLMVTPNNGISPNMKTYIGTTGKLKLTEQTYIAIQIICFKHCDRIMQTI